MKDENPSFMTLPSRSRRAAFLFKSVFLEVFRHPLLFLIS